MTDPPPIPEQAITEGAGEAGALVGAEERLALREAQPRRPRSYLARVTVRTMGRWGAAMGGLWLGFIALLAIFAPLIASSFPLVMKSADGTVSSPWIAFLKPMDVALPLLAAMALLLLFGFRGWATARKWLVFLVVGGSVVGASYLVVSPPALATYDTYRGGLKSGEIEWAVHTPIRFSPSDRLRDQPKAEPVAPSGTHWLGTTRNNADLASRMIHACRIALAVGFIATGIAVVIGVAVGGLMGYFSRTVDLLGMRLVEIFEAIPQLYLLLTFVAFFPRNQYTLYFIMVIIGLVSWTGYARFTRAEFLKLREQDFVVATKALGLPLRSTLFKHMLPNGVAPVLVTASFGIASAILAEAFLSFIGLGLADEPSWGQLLSQAVGGGGTFVWWIAIFPGLAIFLTVFAYNLIGESLRDAIDPHTQKASQA
ncbi:MAG: ABC transporter permease [Planctomycetota bacterium]